MNRTKTEPMLTFQIRLPVTTLEWVDKWRLQQPIPPSRSDVLRRLIERGRSALRERVTINDDGE